MLSFKSALVVGLICLSIIGVVLGGPTSYQVTFEDASDNLRPALLGQKKCTFGPSYWCHNITHAKECGATKHCIEKVWEKQTLPEDNDDVCQVCKEMVKEARDQLLSNETQGELKEVLEGSCKLIPLTLIANECSKLADDFIPELVDALASRMDPQVVCAVSGLCNSARIDEMLLEMKEIEMPKSKPLTLSPADPRSCPRCTVFMGRAFDYLKTLGKDQVKVELMAGCGFLSSYSDSCRMIVLEKFDEFYAHIQNANPKEFCSLLGVCTESTKELAVYEPEKNDDLPCDFCKQLVNRARQWLTDNTTKEDFDKIVQGLCRRCGEHKQDCVNFYKQYGGEIYRLILEDLDADTFCQRIGVCPGSKRLSLFGSSNLKTAASPVWTILKVPEQPEDPDVEEQPMIPLVSGQMMTGNDERNSYKVGPECMLCQSVVHQLQNYLESPETEKDITDFVDHLCDRYLPKEMREQCEGFVTNYGDQFIALVSQEIDPAEICPKLKMCPGRKLQGIRVRDILPTCAICEFTVTKLLDLIGNNHTKESIEAATEKVCEMLPKKYEDNCQTFMENYGDRVLEIILVEGTSHGVCTALRLCFFSPSPTTTNNKIIIESALPFERYSPSAIEGSTDNTEVAGDDPKCVLCEYVISTLASKIKDNATEDEIKSEVEQVCTYLPKSVKNQCRAFVEIYGDLVIQYLVQEMDPAAVCTELKLCKPQVQYGYDLTLSRCELCNVVSDYLSKKLDDPKFEKIGVETTAVKFCPLLRNLKQQCTEMIEDYGPYMMTLLAEKEDNEKVCTMIDIC